MQRVVSYPGLPGQALEVTVRRRTPPARCLMFFLVLLSTGCAPRFTPFGAKRGGEEVRFEVRNQRWEDLTIYLEREGTRVRLGVVPGNETRTLTVPRGLTPTHCWGRLVAMSTGRESRAVSEVFGLAPGDHGSWEIPLGNGLSAVSFGD